MDISVVIPTFNEAANVAPLVAAIGTALDGSDYEIVFADDSTDATPAIIRKAGEADPRVRMHHRARGRGLATAVVEALPVARADTIVVIDGDRQHPPDMIPALLAAAGEEGVDMVVASRYMPGGWDSGLSGPHRRLASKATRLAAYLILPRSRLTTDPLSGFFVFRRAVVEAAALRPVGYKILLEILVRGRVQKVVDVPFGFEPRQAEQSKAGLREAFNYLRQLWRLRG
jgi:dolichol-phosphate mannosyltransferase